MAHGTFLLEARQANCKSRLVKPRPRTYCSKANKPARFGSARILFRDIPGLPFVWNGVPYQFSAFRMRWRGPFYHLKIRAGKNRTSNSGTHFKAWFKAFLKEQKIDQSCNFLKEQKIIELWVKISSWIDLPTPRKNSPMSLYLFYFSCTQIRLGVILIITRTFQSQHISSLLKQIYKF